MAGAGPDDTRLAQEGREPQEQPGCELQWAGQEMHIAHHPCKINGIFLCQTFTESFYAYCFCLGLPAPLSLSLLAKISLPVSCLHPSVIYLSLLCGIHKQLDIYIYYVKTSQSLRLCTNPGSGD